MGEVTGLYTFPLTGAAPHDMNHALVGAAGLRGDREYVFCNPDTLKRLGAKELPALMGARVDTTAAWIAIHHPADDPFLIEADVFSERGQVDEFGDSTPVLLAGRATAQELSERLARPVGLARKTDTWMNGGGIPPADRQNAPLHIVNADTVAALQDNDAGVAFDHSRFRGNIVVEGFEAFSEAQWVGRLLQIGGLVVRISCLTERCPVPGYDPQTGAKLGDVPKLYPRFARAEGGKKPTFGVYAYPLNSVQRDVLIEYGDSVEILE